MKPRKTVRTIEDIPEETKREIIQAMMDMPGSTANDLVSLTGYARSYIRQVGETFLNWGMLDLPERQRGRYRISDVEKIKKALEISKPPPGKAEEPKPMPQQVTVEKEENRFGDFIDYVKRLNAAYGEKCRKYRTAVEKIAVLEGRIIELENESKIGEVDMDNLMEHQEFR